MNEINDIRKIDEFDKVLSKVSKIQNIDLNSIKKMSAEELENAKEIKYFISNVKRIYVNKIIDKIPNEKIIKLSDSSLHRKFKRYESILFGFFSICGVLFISGFLFFVIGCFMSVSKDYLIIPSLIAMFSFLLASISAVIAENNDKKILLNIENEFFKTGRTFESLTREITVEVIEEIRAKSNHLPEIKNKLIDYLVEENYLLEKGNNDNIFKEIKKEILIKIEEHNCTKLVDKRILQKEELTVESKLDFLVAKNNQEKIKC